MDPDDARSEYQGWWIYIDPDEHLVELVDLDLDLDLLDLDLLDLRLRDRDLDLLLLLDLPLRLSFISTIYKDQMKKDSRWIVKLP